MRAARFLLFPVIERSGRGTLTRYRQAAKALQRMIKTYKIEAIAIDNGTASRESKEFVERSLTPLPPSPAERGSAGNNSTKSGNDSKTSSYESENEAPSLKEGAGGRLFQAEEALTLCKQKLAEHQSLTTFKSEEYE